VTSHGAPQVPPPPQAGDGTPAPWEPVPWRFLDAIVVFVLLVFLVAFTSPLASYLAAGAGFEGPYVVLPYAALLTGALTVFYVAVRFDGRWRLLTGPKRGTWGDVGVGTWFGFGAYVFVLLVGLVLRLLVGDDLPTPQPEFQEMARLPDALPFLLIGAIVLAPIGEELFFRGMVFQALRKRMELWPAMGISAVLFALAHMLQGTMAQRLLIFIIIFPLGMLLAWAFERRRSIVAPIILHAVFNTIQVGLMAVAPG
jgi:uncharacterized protein